jgi:glutamate-1-semialdehyde 2,1-aminomutase
MKYQQRLHRAIPGGAHTYSRGDDQYPANAPPILSKGDGCYVTDPDGKEYLDYGMGLLSVTVGYGYQPIVEAALEQMNNGNTLARASVIELEAAERIIDLIPGADMVKFAKNGSTATSAAIKLARAYTNREYVAVCGDHPFFSYDDWFIGSTVMPKGVPSATRKLSVRFRYNDVESLRMILDRYPRQVAAVILEPVWIDPPCSNQLHKKRCDSKCECKLRGQDNFLTEVRRLCDSHGTVLIFDEMRTGFRWHLRGAQEYFGVEPDLSTFGKAMANGFSVAALVGHRDIMELGGIDNEGRERVFLVSSTHGAEMCGLGAFVKTLEVYQEKDVIEHIWNYGRKLKDGLNSISAALDISQYFFVEGYPCSPSFVTKDGSGAMSLELRTLFAQELVESGILMPWLALSYSHGIKELEHTLNAAERALKVYKRCLNEAPREYLLGDPVKPVFRKYN